MAYQSVYHVGPFVTRAMALRLGLVRFCSGIACKREHLTERWSSNNVCLECYKVDRAPQVITPEQQAVKNGWRARNVEKAREMRRAGVQRNKAKEIAWNEAWRTKNIEKKRSYTRNYRAKLRDGGTHTADDIAEIYKLQRGKCAYCRRDLKDGYHVDHILAVANGGSNTRDNLQLTCGWCNQSKGAADAIVFARRVGLLV